MHKGIPFKSRHQLQWQLVLVNPVLLDRAQRRLRASGPSHAIERALELAMASVSGPVAGPKPMVVQ